MLNPLRLCENLIEKQSAWNFLRKKFYVHYLIYSVFHLRLSLQISFTKKNFAKLEFAEVHQKFAFSFYQKTSVKFEEVFNCQTDLIMARFWGKIIICIKGFINLQQIRGRSFEKNKFDISQWEYGRHLRIF